MFELQPRDQSPHLIQDVSMPKTWSNFDTRDALVRQSSIGFLDAQYLRMHHLRGGNIKVNDADEEEPVTIRVRRATGYTRIPPLSAAAVTSGVATSKHYLDGILETCTTFFTELTTKIGQQIRGLNWFPKKYTLYRGVYTDWHTKTFMRARWALPAFVVLGGVLVGTILWQIPAIVPGHFGHAPKQQGNLSNTQSASPTSKNVGKKNANNSTATPESNNASTPSTPAVTPGMGSGMPGYNSAQLPTPTQVTQPTDPPLVDPPIVVTTPPTPDPIIPTPAPITVPQPVPDPVQTITPIINQPLQQVNTIVQSISL